VFDPCGWLYRKKLTVNKTMVSGTQTDFPVLVNLSSDTDLANDAQNSGNDIVFTREDGTTQIPHEIENFTKSSGALLAWVKVPNVTSLENKDIYLYYGNSSTASQENRTGVWDANYHGVWHLADTSGNTLDSTSYSTGGTVVTGVTRGVTGKIGKAFDFSPTDGEVDWGDPLDGHLDFGTGSFTVSTWVNIDGPVGPNAWPQLVWKGFESWAKGYCLEYNDTSNQFTMCINDGTSEYGQGSPYASFSDDTWYHVVGVADRTADKLRIYRNGVEQGTGSTISPIGDLNNTEPLTVSADGSWGFLDGMLDEVRISSGARSAGWILTEFNNQDRPDLFISKGNEEASPCGGGGTPTVFDPCGWLYRKKLTVNKTMVSGTQTDFPVLVNLSSDADLASDAQDSGNDIVFTREDGTTQIPHEIESFSGTTGALLAWLKVPQINSTANTDLYLYYGNSSTASQQNMTGVWTNGFVSVWHLKEDPSGTAPQMKDSRNLNNGTSYGSMTSGDQVAAKINGGLDFDGLNDPDGDSIRAPDYDILNAISISAWINWDVVETDVGIVSKRTDTEVAGNWALRGDASLVGIIQWMIWAGNNDSKDLKSVSTVPADTWTHVALTFDDPTNAAKIYLNGTLNSSGTVDYPLADTAQPIAIGWSGQGDQYFDGLIDEVRISSTVRSAQWIATEYNSTYRPDLFVSRGTEEASPCGTPTTFDPCNWDWRKKITLNKTMVTGTQTGFPILVNLSSDTDLASDAQDSGNDIVFTREDGTTQIPHEIESFSGTTGALIAWVKVPNVNSTANTNIYLYYGNSGTASQQNVPGVWDANYAAVWHLDETPSDGTVDGIEDSTSNDNDGTPMNFQSGGGSTNTVGKIDGADLFGGDNDYITVPGPVNTDPTKNLTVSAWVVRPNTVMTRNEEIISRGDSYAMRVYYEDGGFYAYKYKGSGSWVNMGHYGKLNDSAPHYVVFGMNASGMFMYLDGSLLELRTDADGKAAIVYGLGSTVEIGRHGDGGTGYNYTGKIDEVRISKMERSESWIKTEYANQNRPDLFISAGSEEASPCGGGCEPLAVDAISSGTTIQTNSITFQHTTSGSDRLMLVGVSIGNENLEFVSSVTYNGTALTKIGANVNSDDARTEIWCLTAPDTGTHNVVVTFNQVLQYAAAAGAMTFTGVDQATPTGTYAYNTGTDDNEINVTVPSAANEVVFGVIANENNSVITDAGQTERWNYLVHANLSAAGVTKAGASSVIMNWTRIPSGEGTYWATAGVSIKPSCSGGGGLSPWYDCAWIYRKNITIDKNRVNGTLTNFPVLINHTDTDLRDSARADGYDILFTADDGVTKIPHEIENFTKSSGALVAWVNVSQVTNQTNTTIMMYFNNSGASNQQNAPGVWDANYKGVWHLHENPAGTAPQEHDSTSNDNDGTTGGGMTSGDLVAGAVDGSLDFDNNDVVNAPASTSLNITGAITLEAWVKTSSANSGNVLSKIDTGGSNGYILDVGGHSGMNNGKINYWDGTTDAWRTGNTNVNDGTWHHIAAVHNGSSGYVYLYRDGVPDGSVSGAGARNTNSGQGVNISFKDNSGCTYAYVGLLDEIRVSSGVRSADWIKTEYTNQYSPSTFYNVSPKVSSPCTPAFVQTTANTADGNSMLYLTLPGSSTTGDLMVVSFGTYTSRTASVTDSKGNTYTLANYTTWTGSGHAWTYYASGITGGGSPIQVNVTLSGTATNFWGYATEYSGVTASSPLHMIAVGKGTGAGTQSSGNQTTTQAIELIYGYGLSLNTITPTTPPFNARNTNYDNFIADRTVTTAGSYNVTGSNSAGDWMIQMITFKGG
jgi:hypothetical protein